jgi:2-polyprenyl-3-methyl-5-hydroxy-6-metoxy-1,4-benzoquinol methylase
MTGDNSALIACNLCGGRDVAVLSRRSRSGAQLRTVACRNCGLVWSDPRPHDARRYFEEEYRVAYKRTFEPRPKHVLRAGRVALSRLQKIERFLSARLRILDVGSGGGEFAYLLKSLGHDVHGVEPNRGYADYAAAQYGLDIARGFIGDAELAAASLDVITVWHVLEHTEDPGAVLRKLRRALRPGGTLVVEVPNVEATCQSPASTFHEAHLYNFNTATLDRLAEKSGLHPVASSLSEDGGNITAVYRPGPEGAERTQDLALPGNFERVASVIRRHTPLSHLFSAHPYRRTMCRLGRMLDERRHTNHPATGREILDTLYARALGPRASANDTAARPSHG